MGKPRSMRTSRLVTATSTGVAGFLNFGGQFTSEGEAALGRLTVQHVLEDSTGPTLFTVEGTLGESGVWTTLVPEQLASTAGASVNSDFPLTFDRARVSVSDHTSGTLRVVAAANRRPSVLGKAQAFWKASRYAGSGSWLDLSGHGHDAALPGGTNNPTFYNLTATGGKPYLRLPGVASNYASTPDHASLDIVGDLDLRWYGSLDDWTPASTMSFVGKWTAAGNQRSYGLLTTTDGKLYCYLSTDGVNAVTKTSSVATGFTDGQVYGVRCTVDIDNGAGGYDVKFWTRGDPDIASHTGWTQLGTTQTTAGAYSLFSGSSAVEVGSQAAGGSNPLKGKALRAMVLDGIAGTVVADIDFTTWADEASTQVDNAGRTWTINTSGTAEVARLVKRPHWWFDTDDYFSVADNDALDFADGQNATWAIAFRPFQFSAFQVPLSKAANVATGAGYYVLLAQTTGVPSVGIADGTTAATDALPAATAATPVVIVGVLDEAAPTLTGYKNGASSGSPATTAIGDKSNALALQIGRIATTFYFQGEIYGAAIFREALTAAEVAELRVELMR